MKRQHDTLTRYEVKRLNKQARKRELKQRDRDERWSK